MKYCIKYNRAHSFKYMDEIDELEIRYNKKDVTLPDFLDKYSDKTIVISNINNVEDVERMKLLYGKYPHLKLKIHFDDLEILNLVRQYGLPFFLSGMVTNWDTFYGVVKLNPTDIYLSNEIAFEMAAAAKIAHDKGIKVRVIPNYGQSAWEIMPDMLKFFIRPDDIEEYEDYVDIFEIYYEKDFQLSILYEIYTDKRDWSGFLNEIIFNFSKQQLNDALIPCFGLIRSNCGKKCLKGKNCNICNLSALDFPTTATEEEE